VIGKLTGAPVPSAPPAHAPMWMTFTLWPLGSF
jgi:hypothetical protein